MPRNCSASRRWWLNVGGDILTRGGPWAAGIVDPGGATRCWARSRCRGTAAAFATSGSAERGDHIWPGGRAPADFVQVTVLADDIVTADVLATAIVAGGRRTLDDLTDRFDVDVLTIDHAGEATATPGMARQLTRSAA